MPVHRDLATIHNHSFAGCEGIGFARLIKDPDRLSLLRKEVVVGIAENLGVQHIDGRYHCPCCAANYAQLRTANGHLLFCKAAGSRVPSKEEFRRRFSVVKKGVDGAFGCVVKGCTKP